MITCAPLPTAAAICTICCSATVSSPTRRRTSIGASIAASIAVARLSISPRETNRPRTGRAPRHRVSATDRFSQNASSWWTIPMPAASASRGSSNWTERPSTMISPPSGCSMPASSLPSVLLPAPFSPHSAWHDPRRTSKLTSSRARAPGKRLLTWRKLTIELFDVAAVFDFVDVADCTNALSALLELQVFLGDIGEAPLPKLARPRPERLAGDPHRIHRNDLRNVLLVEELVDDLGDADVAPQIGRLREQHRREALFDVRELCRQRVDRHQLHLLRVQIGEQR